MAIVNYRKSNLTTNSDLLNSLNFQDTMILQNRQILNILALWPGTICNKISFIRWCRPLRGKITSPWFNYSTDLTHKIYFIKNKIHYLVTSMFLWCEIHQNNQNHSGNGQRKTCDKTFFQSSLTSNQINCLCMLKHLIRNSMKKARIWNYWSHNNKLPMLST